jgi:DNA-binding NarL/FixJ family response regulator
MANSEGTCETVRVLLVDDDPMVLQLLRARLDRAEGIELVGSARSGAAALRLVKTRHPDVVVLDLAMPRMDGLEIARRLHDAFPRVRVVILTGYASPEAEGLLRALGARAFLPKTVSATALLAAIRGAYHAPPSEPSPVRAEHRRQ